MRPFNNKKGPTAGPRHPARPFGHPGANRQSVIWKDRLFPGERASARWRPKLAAHAVFLRGVARVSKPSITTIKQSPTVGGRSPSSFFSSDDPAQLCHCSHEIPSICGSCARSDQRPAIDGVPIVLPISHSPGKRTSAARKRNTTCISRRPAAGSCPAQIAIWGSWSRLCVADVFFRSQGK